MTYVKINDTLYSATIEGRMSDSNWDGRKSKTIHLSMSYDDVTSLFGNDVSWSIVMDVDVSKPVLDEEGNETGQYEISQIQQEYDNSDFNILGDITIHNDGTISIKMGQMTDLEKALNMILEV